MSKRPVETRSAARARAAVARAWELRESDQQTARRLAADARLQLPEWAGSERARLDLLEAVFALNANDFAAFERWADLAERAWSRLDERAGLVDARMLRARLHFRQSRTPRALAMAEEAEALAREAGDDTRALDARAARGYWMLAQDVPGAAAQWGDFMEALRRHDDPALALWGESFVAYVALHDGDIGAAILAFERAYVHAQRAGAVRTAINTVASLSVALLNANRQVEALDAAERVLAMARQAGWPTSVGLGLRMVGNALTQLGRLDGARSALEECLQVLAPQKGTHEELTARIELAKVVLAQGAPLEAEAQLAAVQTQLEGGERHPFTHYLMYHRATALQAAGQTQRARELVREYMALARARGARLGESEGLVLLASLYAGEPAEALPLLEQALAVGRQTDSWLPNVTLLRDLADAYLALGRPEAAWPLLLEAHQRQDQEEQRLRTERAVVAEATQRLAHERAEAQRARHEADLRAREAALLQSANHGLSRLGRLGRRLLMETSFAGVQQRLAAEAPRLLGARAVRLRPPGAPPPAARPGQVVLQRHIRWQGVVTATLWASLDRRASAADRQWVRALAAWIAVACEHVGAHEAWQRTVERLRSAASDAEGARRRLDDAMAERRRFTGFLAHDLRSPLSTLQGMLDALQVPPPGVSLDDLARYLTAARHSAARLRSMLDELRQLSDRHDGMLAPRPAALSLPELVRAQFARVELQAMRRRLRMEIWHEPGLGAAWADPGMVERALGNLVDNAVRHASPGGRVRVELASDRDRMRVAVLNDGDPIPAPARQGLFEQPGRRPVRHASAGLGLLGVKRLVTLHGADVRMLDRPGWGVAFEFALPARTRADSTPGDD